VTVRVPIPRLNDTAESFSSRLLDVPGRRMDCLGCKVIEMCVRGLSTRSIDALLRDDDGELLLSRSTVSELSQKLSDEYEQLATSDLIELEHRRREKKLDKKSGLDYKLARKVRQVVWCLEFLHNFWVLTHCKGVRRIPKIFLVTYDKGQG